MGTEIAFTVSKIPLNGYAVHSTERLTKKDHKPVNEANNMGLHVKRIIASLKLGKIVLMASS